MPPNKNKTADGAGEGKAHARGATTLQIRNCIKRTLTNSTIDVQRSLRLEAGSAYNAHADLLMSALTQYTAVSILIL